MNTTNREEPDWSHLQDDPCVIPPLNFGMVATGLYRSAFPSPINFSFLKSLRLSTILNLANEKYDEDMEQFFTECGVSVIHAPLEGNVEPFQGMDPASVHALLPIIQEASSHARVLVHCWMGTHRTGCLIGCLRKACHWSLSSIFSEYRMFAHSHTRQQDEVFIGAFQPCISEQGRNSESTTET